MRPNTGRGGKRLSENHGRDNEGLKWGPISSGAGEERIRLGKLLSKSGNQNLVPNEQEEVTEGDFEVSRRGN